jgi:hypothetical protein
LLIVRRILLVLSVAALMAALLVVGAVPAFAAKEGPRPFNFGQCHALFSADPEGFLVGSHAELNELTSPGDNICQLPIPPGQIRNFGS